jgi:hypothetical protein
MPSSSSNTTHLEKSLATHFRRIFIHLSMSSRWEELDYLLDTFASTLDLSDHSLQLAFYPLSLPWHERTTVAVRAEIEALDQMRGRSNAMKSSERICKAGTKCADIGWVLKGVGREKEGEMWCGFERVLEKLAWEVEEDEKRAQQAILMLPTAEEERRVRARRAQVEGMEVVEID